MRTLAISVLMALALAACGPQSQQPAEDTAPAPSEEASQTPAEPPVEPQPEPPPPPASTAPPPVTSAPPPSVDDNVTAAPEPDRSTAARPSLPRDREIVQAPDLQTRGINPQGRIAPSPNIAPPPPATSAPVTRSLRVTATPVIVEIDRTQDRRPANGGSSVVLFSEGAANAYRNTVTCVNVWNLMDTATTQEVRVGVRKAEDGSVEALRPLYWLNKTTTPAGERSCSQRMANYDFTRAKTIRDKYRLTGVGPYFVVARSDEQAAAIIDLAGKTDREVADLVRYFRDGFAFQNDIWDPARNDPTKKRALLASFFGARFRESLVVALGFVSAPAARAGCRLGDLRDAPCT